MLSPTKSSSSNLRRHFKAKHEINTDQAIKPRKPLQTKFICELCGKVLKSRYAWAIWRLKFVLLNLNPKWLWTLKLAPLKVVSQAKTYGTSTIPMSIMWIKVLWRSQSKTSRQTKARAWPYKNHRFGQNPTKHRTRWFTFKWSILKHLNL